MARKKRKRVDCDSPLMNIYSPEYQYLMRQNAPENANVAGLGDWFSKLFKRNNQQPDYHRDTVSMGLGTENSLQGVGNGGTDWNNQNFSLTNQQQINYDSNQELTTSQQYQNALKDPENLAPKQTEQSAQPSAGSNVNWGGIIGSAATATINAIDNGGSTADIVANAMGIPELANIWQADKTKANEQIKGIQENIANFHKNNYIQDANSSQGVNQGLKLNNKPIQLLNVNPTKNLTVKDFKGNWWKSMAKAQLQGAAAGSVGGPWGALGGATAGLLGSIGGLFGRKKRAKKAYNEYQQTLNDYKAYGLQENAKLLIERDVANNNLIHNGLGQQSIKEMSNFKAYGGNLYPDGGNVDPYYPKTSDPDAIHWLSDWYSQRPNQIQNTFGNSHNLSFTQIRPNMNESYYGEDNVPSNRRVYYDLLTYPTEEEYNKNLYKNLMDRAAASSNIFSENMWEGAGGTYSNDGIHFVQNPNFDPNYNDWLMQQWKAGNYVNMDESKNTPETLISGDNYKNTIMYNWKAMNERNDAMSTRIHERTHSMVTDPLLNSIDTGLQDAINSRVKLRKDFNKEHYGGNDAYWDNPNEIYSRMNEFRYESGLRGSDNVDQKFLNDNRKLLEEKGLDRYTDDSLLKLFNEVADNNNINQYNNIAAYGGQFDMNLSPNMMSMWNNKQQIDMQKVMNQQMNFGLGNSFNQKLNTFDYGGNINKPIDPDPEETKVELSPEDKYKIDFIERGYGYHKNSEGEDWWKNAAGKYGADSARIANLYENRTKLTPAQQYDLFDRLTVRTPKIWENGYDKLQDKDGNWLVPNEFDYGGSMNGLDIPTNMQYYENGGTHEENPYGGIQVGVDPQGNPNLVEEGEFRYGDYIFSDRIPVDYSILSDFNAGKSKGNRNTKNNPTYAELAKKTADKYKDLNDQISKDSLNKQLDRLQQSQEAQKFKEQQDQQYADYKSALKNPTQGNPMYGNMKYNGMGNANQGVNAGIDDDVSTMDNSDLSNVNRSGNPMMAAYGGNLFDSGGSAINKPKKILPWEESMNLEYRTTIPQAKTLAGININTNPYYGNVRDHQQLLINNGYNIVPNGVYGPATEKAMTDFRHKIYGQSQAGTQTVNNPNFNSTYSSDKQYIKYDVPINQDSPESETGEVTDSTETNSSTDNVVPGENLGEVNRQQGNLAGSSPFVWNRYNEAGRYGQLAKGLVPNLMNGSGQTNWNYNPDWRPSNELEALGHSSYANRTADHLGDYIAPNLMDIERLNNAAMAQTAAQQRGIQNISGGNRGFVGAQNAATDYNGQMGIGNNYVTTEQYNAEQQQKAAEFNRDTNKFNAQANNDMYRDNLNAWMQGRQMDIQAMEAANRERQTERQYKDKVDRDAALNKQRDLAAMFDNTMNFLADEAEYNRRLNDMNSRRNSRFWYDKKEGWQERNDNGFTSKLNAAIDGAILNYDDFNQISKIQNNDKYTDDEKIAMIQNIADSARARNKQENDAITAEKKKEIQNYLSEAQNYYNLLNGIQDYQPWNNAKNRYSDPNYFTYTDNLSKEIAKHRMDELQNMWFNYITRYNPNAVEEVPTSQTTKTGKTSAYGGKLKRRREYDYMSI